MKKNIKIQLYSILLFLLSSLSTVRAALNPEEPPEDTPTASIGDYIWILTILGIAFIYFKVNKKSRAIR